MRHHVIPTKHDRCDRNCENVRNWLCHHDKQSIGRWERGEFDIDSSAEAIIRRLAIEKLELNAKQGMEELSRRSVPTVKTQPINIRKTGCNDNSSYELTAA